MNTHEPAEGETTRSLEWPGLFFEIRFFHDSMVAYAGDERWYRLGNRTRKGVVRTAVNLEEKEERFSTGREEYGGSRVKVV